MGLAHPVCCLFSLLFIGGAVDLQRSDYARVAKIFYNLALKVWTAASSSRRFLC